MEISVSGFALLALSLAAAGLVTGVLAGLFGIGGGGILVPVLYETFSQLGVDPAIRMQMALGTSLLVIAPTSLKSFSGHRARGLVDEALLRRLIPWVVVGVIGGVLVARTAPSSALKSVWVVAGSLLAFKMFLGRDDWRLGPEIPKSFLVEAYAGVVGFLSTLMSVGGAAFFVTLMTLYGRSLLSAVSTASGFGPAIAIPGIIGFVWAGYGNASAPPLSLGFVSLIGAALIIPTSLLAAPWGVKLAHGIPKRRLELAFATFLLVVALRFLASLVFG
jgi:uncharacterized membrane protein YfcA